MAQAPEVIVVGGGLAGLAAARALAARAIPVQVLEASAEVGGRVATDEVDGFLLDRGFQVLLGSYPEARRVLDLAGLDLHPFAAGALIHRGGRMGRVADPWRDPLAGMRSLVSGVFTPADAWRMMRLRSDALLGESRDPGTSTQTTARALADRGFSERAIESFFRPFFGGVFLDPTLQTSSRMFDFVFKMFGQDSIAVPVAGMEAIPRQLAERLGPGTIRTNARVEHVVSGEVWLSDGETLSAPAIVVATEATQAVPLLGDVVKAPPAWKGTTTLYYAAERAPVDEPILVLNGEGGGPVNSVAVMSNVSSAYAPAGASLVSVNVLEDGDLDETALDTAVREQLAGWFGPYVSGWKLLRTYRIPEALPAQPPEWLEPVRREVRVSPGLYLAGDYLEMASINGALAAGRRAAAAVVADRKV